jgi:hypothetical protein
MSTTNNAHQETRTLFKNRDGGWAEKMARVREASESIIDHCCALS